MTKKGENQGIIIKMVTPEIKQEAIAVIMKFNKVDNISSIWSKSFPNLLRILPFGVVSKNRKVAELKLLTKDSNNTRPTWNNQKLH